MAAASADAAHAAVLAAPVDRGRRRLLTMAATTLAAMRPDPAGSAAVHQSAPRLIEALGRPTTWLNSPALPASALRGRPVLVQFGTYSCINWLRTLPYIRAWHRKYGDRVVMIVVHTPEFSFEHDLSNVRPAVQGLQLGFPVAVDNDYAIWRSFDNHYWPALYFVDARGRVRDQHFGEGAYAQSERAIRALLNDTSATGAAAGDGPLAAGSGVELQADWENLQSPEIYLGSRRTRHFASPGGAVAGRRRVYAAPDQLAPNTWALAGDWTIAEEPVTLNQAPGAIACRFHARDAHLVMGSRRPGQSVRIRVTLDGHRPGSACGGDIYADGYGRVAEPRLYHLIRQSETILDRTLRIEFLDAGAQAFALTFG